MRTTATRRGALLACVLLVAACGGGEEEGYSEEYEAAFVNTCVDASGSPGEAPCQCWYEGVRDSIPFEDLPQLDRLVADSDAEDLPEEPFAILARCAVNAAPAPTVPTTTTTTIPPPTAPTTTAAP